MDPDETKVKDYLEERGFIVERFPKEDTRVGKTPDFQVFRNGEFLFYCEVKSSSQNQWLDEQLKHAVPGELVGGGRSDPIFNRLENHIHGAMKQFDAVNEGQTHPNVLVFVNHDVMCGFNDLLAVITGNFYADDGTVHPIYRKFSNGRIKNEKERVHLYIWLDDHKPPRMVFSETEETLHATLCAAFDVGQNEIKQIGS
ncbi:hypothetical protein BI364_04225 [Acidihalobacter yilgarnensis]|uniref:Uncharacterized protein n=1 Tax=Acidihalobacter yilgarnensis TaxID=2819280 RepID=A0A1D8ISP6_9GAMM|nr:hypothetical protein [Acidihalobacter yilgarnensis]AOU99530.1 hypothetical protein BI364_04225 [Acidihalobacter yilgarnensis]